MSTRTQIERLTEMKAHVEASGGVWDDTKRQSLIADDRYQRRARPSRYMRPAQGPVLPMGRHMSAQTYSALAQLRETDPDAAIRFMAAVASARQP